MARFDMEKVLDQYVSTLQDGLNTKINAINAEKNDGITLLEVNTANYFDSLDDRIANCNPFLYYGIAGVELIEGNGDFGADVECFFTIALETQGHQAKIYKSMLRYIRALEETFINKLNSFPGEMSRPTIDSILPEDIRDQEGQGFAKIAGVLIKTSIAT